MNNNLQSLNLISSYKSYNMFMGPDKLEASMGNLILTYVWINKKYNVIIIITMDEDSIWNNIE